MNFAPQGSPEESLTSSQHQAGLAFMGYLGKVGQGLLQSCGCCAFTVRAEEQWENSGWFWYEIIPDLKALMFEIP